MTLDADDLLPRLEPWRDAGCWWLALSGGLDSTVLLDLLAELRDSHDIPRLAAIHIDHQLHPDSGQWAAHCAATCERLEVPLETRRVVVEDSGEGPEAAARAARYRSFESLLDGGDLLLLAHHLDDQVETFFLRLMRGAGTRGLSGMPASRPLGQGTLLRPLLEVPRAALEVRAAQRRLAWIDDSSNADTALDRNFLRQRLLPLLAERWPTYRHSVERSRQALADAESLLAAVDGPRLDGARGCAFGEPFLDLDCLAPASAGELARMLRRWLETEGVAPPSQSQLLEFGRQSLAAREDSQPALTVSGYCLRRYRRRLYLGPSRAPALPGEMELAPGRPVVLSGLGRLEMVPTAEGLRLPACGAWQLRFREGGERCRPLGRRGRQGLKKLLQEYQVPPWLRESLPLVYEAGELAAVADLWICEGFQAGAGEPAYRLVWERNAPALD